MVLVDDLYHFHLHNSQYFQFSRKVYEFLYSSLSLFFTPWSPKRQNLQDFMFSFWWLKRDFVFLPGVDDRFVSQNHREFYGFKFLGQIQEIHFSFFQSLWKFSVEIPIPDILVLVFLFCKLSFITSMRLVV